METLSDKSLGLEDWETMLMPDERSFLEEYVKEFIKKLEERFSKDKSPHQGRILIRFKQEIDKLAGDKLI